MRLIQWNCQGAFRKKNKSLFSLQPDILTVSECERPDKLEIGRLTPTPEEYYWHGDSGHKGIGIFAFSGYKIELMKIFNPMFRYILPFRVTGNGCDYTLLAIWAMNNKERREARYIGQIWLAINHYKDQLTDTVILLGDFNSNKIWDTKKRIGNHSDVVNLLQGHDIHSLYHSKKNEIQGEESEATFYMNRNRERPYHIDYCFASKGIIREGFDFKVGEYETWIDKSDHAPIIIDLHNNR